MDIYRDRKDAGQVLARWLGDYADNKDVIVLALPRGGVPVGYEIAKALHVPLDVFIVRKLGVPTHPELAMGAVAEGGQVVLNHEIMRESQVSAAAFDQVKKNEMEELARRVHLYRGDRPFPELKNKIIILVDDGVATGASLHAAMNALKTFHPKKLVVAVPVAPPETLQALSSLADDFICPQQPAYLNAVGAWYEVFSQIEDDEVRQLLNSL